MCPQASNDNAQAIAAASADALAKAFATALATAKATITSDKHVRLFTTSNMPLQAICTVLF